MKWNSLVALAFVAPSHALIRFGCSQLVVDRLDPLVNPGITPSPHLHQIIGGVSRTRSLPVARLGFLTHAELVQCLYGAGSSRSREIVDVHLVPARR